MSIANDGNCENDVQQSNRYMYGFIALYIVATGVLVYATSIGADATIHFEGVMGEIPLPADFQVWMNDGEGPVLVNATNATLSVTGYDIVILKESAKDVASEIIQLAYAGFGGFPHPSVWDDVATEFLQGNGYFLRNTNGGLLTFKMSANYYLLVRAFVRVGFNASETFYNEDGEEVGDFTVPFVFSPLDPEVDGFAVDAEGDDQANQNMALVIPRFTTNISISGLSVNLEDAETMARTVGDVSPFTANYGLQVRGTVTNVGFIWADAFATGGVIAS